MIRTFVECIAFSKIIVLNKCDVYGAEENIKEFKKKVKKHKILTTSAITGEGAEEVIKELYSVLKDLPPYEPEGDSGFIYERAGTDTFEIERDEDGAFIVLGDLVKTLSRNVVLDDMDSMSYMQKVLRDKGVIKKLRELGAKDGDVVVIGNVEFDFID